MKEKHKKVEYAEKEAEAPADGTTDTTPKDVSSVFVNNLLTSINNINNAIVYKDNRYILRMLKYIKCMRLSIKNESSTLMPIMTNLISKTFKEGYPIYEILFKYINEFKELPKEVPEFSNINDKTYTHAAPEIEVFFYIMILLYLLDKKCYNEAMDLSTVIVNRITKLNRRSLDCINAKVYFYFSWVHELGGKLSHVRQKLLYIYRNACLHRDIMTQTVVLNLILRDYIKHNLYDLAVKFVSKTSFPENSSSNAQHARYLYYIGKILAIQLDYSEAHSKITQAIRKAPQNNQSAKGFKLEATKMEIIVELLMGDIPDRSLFSNKIMRNKLIPYKHVVTAVRNGDINKFSKVMNDYNQLFMRDGVYLLIKRIHHNVIKTALRIINLSYSRISISDIGKKIGVESPLDIVGITAKAIHDGVIEATIDYDNQYVESKSNSDVYVTSDPMKTFHKRIAFCLQLYSDAVKAMQYPDENEKKENEEAKERKIRQQEELAQAEEGDLGDDNDLL
ncbi:26S proteasome regulatory subunit RPN3, putative [Plasmodium knowlesi strain H]|uniref:26S proteasome regulatory subunit RPN3, putative n=3 Tax=Plasmodium knowlesi TaxID=5850 RepID=A0A5K1U543_PLAKH|nr:26S proteasome regulatory subunit RPN3, putative [Plasmodium knowlesi strain H]OTN66375.1 putative 26S proteasome regulatory subunit RPN3 [Plasmodium knowlesi]CAA9989952.1 26S proteasome regulatory subunit RPN3, putative [Plasmodium knowlesi strain H]SBO24532.1 26S proteasome regulatory subunit RPN3, putative [Plasmodium knowlesi strain H]SBO26400.1 26S proteasome regulatory subunit RPN3, putative [Plasmodium knowlesi strain H]VVS79426.1 26S proteasome regulatory subunit RPN3, putative [Pla|eukprot:XP_002259967.1 proteasome regulatory component, putative [Plasmodium knowlesi strain H]